jgi:hypothetical protein
MSTGFWLKDAGYLRLLSILEGIVGDCVQNNGRQIRYPIDWPDGSRLRGKETILKTQEHTFEEMAEGRYVFGANELFVYRALDKVLQFLAVKMKDPSPLFELVEKLKNESATEAE